MYKKSVVFAICALAALFAAGAAFGQVTTATLYGTVTDPTGAELMVESLGRLVERHVALFVTIEDHELEELREREPATIGDLAVAVTAETLARQRAVVLQRLRQLGVDVIEAPHREIGYRLIDRYLEIKRKGTIG